MARANSPLAELQEEALMVLEMRTFGSSQMTSVDCEL
jgi:hypothetical protein